MSAELSKEEMNAVIAMLQSKGYCVIPPKTQKYRVRATWTEYHIVEVEATSKEDAAEQVEEMWNSGGLASYDGSFNVKEIEEIKEI